MAEFEMVDQKERLAKVLMKMKQLEEEKRQAMSEFKSEIDGQKELAYSIAKEILQGAPTLSDGLNDREDVQDAEEVLDVEILPGCGMTQRVQGPPCSLCSSPETCPWPMPVAFLGGEAVCPETGELSKKDAGGNDIDEPEKEEGICPRGYTTISIENCADCKHYATCGLPEEGEE